MSRKLLQVTELCFIFKEHFNIATSQKEIIKNAECEDGPTFQLLQKLSKELNIYIVGGKVD